MTDSNQAVGQKAETAQPPSEQERAIRPAMDIFEDDTGITVQADMPGVPRDGLEIHIERDVLSIEGKIDIAMPEGMQPLYADVQSSRYRRSFTLSRELDGERIEAGLRDGVLTLRIPKREERRPRKIEVTTD
jgi:HSP20 family molecular chaperone IbpA